MKTGVGSPSPLGATWDGEGVNFALWSHNATGVELCLFDSTAATSESHRLPLGKNEDHIWHIYVPGVGPGCLYGYRVQGPYMPASGHRFNPAKILVDPYAKQIARLLTWDESLFGYRRDDPDQDQAINETDSAAHAPLCQVVDPEFDWQDDQPPSIPWEQTVIYETHVKGLTWRHPEIPENLRGTYAGLASPPILDHLKNLGVTAVELLPIQHHAEENHLLEKGLFNYWGYNTLAFFAPDRRYCVQDPGDPCREFKQMVRTLHTAGIEVILDVVYNHTPEGNHLGPTLSFRGIDNVAYYRLDPSQPRHYLNFSGCGNTYNTLHPAALDLVIDSLRYWVREMHVDGFRFDLTSCLVRDQQGYDKNSPFFQRIKNDPVISRVKLIAEPWDIGDGGYQVGNFPHGWQEWNGQFRDTVRGFWKGNRGQVGLLATRIAGNSDLYQWDQRDPLASINFIISHDGFTLHDLVSYKRKNNKNNQENNQDGTNDNQSWNCGIEGPTVNARVRAQREQHKRNLMATLILSQGVPMICGGDEMGRTQGGNNNAYCQDNEISWHHWQWTEEQKEFFEFTRKIILFRKDNPVLRRSDFFKGDKVNGSEIKDITWFSPSGKEMVTEDWQNSAVQCLGMRLDGKGVEADLKQTQPPATLLILINSGKKKVPFVLPAHRPKSRWEVVIDTDQEAETEPKPIHGGKPYPLRKKTLVVLRLQPPGAFSHRGNT